MAGGDGISIMVYAVQMAAEQWISKQDWGLSSMQDSVSCENLQKQEKKSDLEKKNYLEGLTAHKAEEYWKKTNQTWGKQEVDHVGL